MARRLLQIQNDDSKTVMHENGYALDAFDVVKTPFHTPSLSWKNTPESCKASIARQDIITLSALSYSMVRRINWPCAFSSFKFSQSDDLKPSLTYGHSGDKCLRELNKALNRSFSSYSAIDHLPVVEFSNLDELGGKYQLHLKTSLSELTGYAQKDREFSTELKSLKDSKGLENALCDAHCLARLHANTDFGLSVDKEYGRNNVKIVFNVRSQISVEDDLNQYTKALSCVVARISEYNGFVKKLTEQE